MTASALFVEQSFHSACGGAGIFSLLVQRKVTKRKHVGTVRPMGGTAQSFGEQTKEACTTRSSQIGLLFASPATKERQAKRRTFQFVADGLHVEGFVTLQGFGEGPPEARSFSGVSLVTFFAPAKKVTRPRPQAGRKLCPKNHSGRAS
jgi:hypothetical protein